ncbi:SLC13 family permease [Bacteroidota bacterium]
MYKKFGLFSGIIVAILIFAIIDFGFNNESQKIMASISALMAIWWISEAIPLAATSLVPLVLFPLTGLVSGSDTASSYINSTIFLFLGGFIIAIAMEEWDLHKRIALNLITKFGKSPSTIILGFMISAGFLSMWISNTATAIMLLPIGMAILRKVEKDFGEVNTRKFSISLMLSIAYACSIGGITTIIGTPPNLVFTRIYSITFPDKPEILFGQWIILILPISIIMLGVVWFVLTRILYKVDKCVMIDNKVVKEEKKKLGSISYEEKVVLIIFILTALLWIFRKEINIGFIIIPGWSSLFQNPKYIDDGTIAIAMSLLCFFLPSKANKNSSILTVSVFRRVPWEIILLFGGGFALAKGFVNSGLSTFIGNQFSFLVNTPIIITIGFICFTITFLTELTSNTATSQIVLPILAALGITIGIEPLLLMIPATISASMAFMMPVATPPNAIVFASQRITILNMVKAGFIFNLIGVVVITFVMYYSIKIFLL